MTINTTNLVPIDFETLKADLVNYLSGQAAFKDYNFQASNLDILAEVLAYNTFRNTFYLNMVMSEMFIDSAQLRDSVVSHAKSLNYIPRSFRSAKAQVNIEIAPNNPGTIQSILIPKGFTFTSRVGSQSFTFTTNENVVVLNEQNTFKALNVDLYEGVFLTETYVYKPGNRFVISNQTVDTSSINVVVIDRDKPTVYKQATSFVGLTGSSEVYFLQAAENNQYEIFFGDGTFGHKPSSGSIVVIEYRISNGELANTANVFEPDGTLGGSSDITVSVVTPALGGAVPETIDEVRFRAPLAFATQDRAVTASDYVTLIRQQFPDITRVSVFGGEELDPPRFGQVVISMINDNADAVTETRQNDVIQFLRKKAPITITPLAVNPEFTYARVTCDVKYDVNKTTKSARDIQLSVISAVKTFADSYINDFGSTLYYSKLVAAIDASDTSVIGNETTIDVYKIFVPKLSQEMSLTLDFGNELYNGPPAVSPHTIQDTYTIYSTFFTFDGKRCSLEDDGNGYVNIITEIGSSRLAVKKNIGTLDYTTGRMQLTNITFDGYEGGGITVYAKLKGKNATAVKNNVLVLEDGDILVTATVG